MQENGTLERLRERFIVELLEQPMVGAPAEKEAR